MNDFGVRKGLVILAVISALALLQGCAATRGSVGQPANERISTLERQLTKMENRFPAIENRLASIEDKVDHVATKTEQVEAKADQARSDIGSLRMEKRLDLDLKDGVLYRFDSAMLTHEGKKSIDVFLSDLTNDNNKARRTFVVGGHADSTGTDRYNYELGRKRADSVAQYLILEKKIDPMQVVTVSFGESSPQADNGTSEGQKKNRRVEIRVFSEIITTSSGITTAQR